MKRVSRFLAGALALAALAGCGSSKHPVTATTPGTTTVSVYFLRNGQVKPVAREVPKAEAAYLGAWRALTRGFAAGEWIGLSSQVVANDSDTLDRSSGGVVKLTKSAQPRKALAQIVYTEASFSAGGAVVVNGKRYTRADFEAETPAILVESPLPSQIAPSPIRVTGTANTFEATFQYELLDAAGTVIAKHFVTATSGSGTRGTFDVTIPYPAGHAGPGKLVVYENSAKDGARINVAKIPLRLTG